MWFKDAPLIEASSQASGGVVLLLDDQVAAALISGTAGEVCVPDKACPAGGLCMIEGSAEYTAVDLSDDLVVEIEGLLAKAGTTRRNWFVRACVCPGVALC